MKLDREKLTGCRMVVGDNISTKGIKTTANSKMLEEYIPPFNATVVERLLQEGAIVAEKGSIKEFGVGKNDNPWGSAKSVAEGKVDFGIASDTKGEICQSASYYGIYGLKPSYGLISRYGLIGCASSIDTIGILSKSIKDMTNILQAIEGKDSKDSTSIEIEKRDYQKPVDMDIRGIKIGVLEEDMLESLRALEEMGANIDKIDIPSLDYGPEAYEIISSGEFSSNMARFDGIGYGYRTNNYENIEELYKKSRSESLGDEVKKKILFGNFVLSSDQYKDYYEKAQKVRTMIKEELEHIFKNYDFVITSTSSNYVIGANLAGLPTLSIPYDYGKDNKGMQIIGSAFKEEKLLELGYIYEEKILKEDRIGGEK